MNFSGNYDETANPPHLVVMYLPFPSNTGLGAAFGLVTSRRSVGMRQKRPHFRIAVSLQCDRSRERRRENGNRKEGRKAGGRLPWN